jgi:hypothetical protein
MKLSAVNYKNPFENFYYIMVYTNGEEHVSDDSIPEILGITPKKYNRILRQSGAYRKQNCGYCFHREGDCLQAILRLEPFLIMATLTE